MQPIQYIEYEIINQIMEKEIPEDKIVEYKDWLEHHKDILVFFAIYQHETPTYIINTLLKIQQNNQYDNATLVELYSDNSETLYYAYVKKDGVFDPNRIQLMQTKEKIRRLKAEFKIAFIGLKELNEAVYFKNGYNVIDFQIQDILEELEKNV